MGLEEIFRDADILHPIKDSSTGRLEHLGMLGSHYGLDLTDIELIQLGQRISERMNFDLTECFFGVNDMLERMYGTKLNEFQTLNFVRPITNYEFLIELSNSSLIDPTELNEETMQYIEDIRMYANPEIIEKAKKTINHYVLLREDIQRSLTKKIDIPVEAIIFSKKDIESKACKLLNLNGRVLNPLEADVKKYFGYDKETNLNPKDYELGKEHITTITLDYFSHLFKSKEDCYKFHYNQGKNFDFQGLNDRYFQDLANVFLVDTVRAKIVLETEDENDKFDEKMKKFSKSDGLTYGLLEGRIEFASFLRDDPNQESTDGSSSYGISGNVPASFFEVKTQAKKSFLEGEIGGSNNPKIKPHWKYCSGKRAKTGLYVTGGSIMEVPSYRVCTMHGLDRSNLLKCGKFI